MNLVPRRGFVGVLTLVLLLAGLPANLQRTRAETRAQTTPVTSHPRLWVTADDLPHLRGWATDANPMWRDGLLVVAEQAKADMDAGTVPREDDGSRGWQAYPTENYAELFAFLSLIHPDEAARADYADRARTLLMYAMNEAVKGPAEGERFRDPTFTIPDSNRLRWWGESWALTVDWIYPELSTEDKATIRTVFLRWSEEMVTLGYNHPEPIGLTNDPALYANPRALRWSGNNYFTSHMRDVGLMALVLDAEDDPGGELRAYLATAIGAHLYITDHLLRTDSRGGLAPEGFEYSPQTLAYVVQFLLALQTAGEADSTRWGRQVVLTDNPFWDEVIPAFLHSLSPRTVLIPGYEYLGPVSQPAWYGDGETYLGPDMIGLLGALGRYDDLTGNRERLDAIRWIETYTPPGGADMLISDRVVYAGGLGSFVNAILYFLIFDPNATPPADPRPSLPLTHFAPGIGRLLARTGWDEDAAWFTYALGWIAIDHQFADGNSFGFYRGGEWLTKPLVGYGGEYGDEDPSDDFYYPSSDHQNTLALENEPGFSATTPTDYRNQLYRRGSQWEYVAAGDPTILALSVASGYTYALGDATNLYNSIDEGSTDVLHASRSIVWLAPDTIVVYDRAASKTDGRFKRFWLNLPADATVDGTRTTMTTASGQQLVLDTLLPVAATPQVRLLDNPVDTLPIGEPMRYQFLVEAPDNPRETRFLNVLHGADAGAAVGPVVSLESADGAFAGTMVGTTAVLFPVDLGVEVGEVRYTVPAETTTHLITGLTPNTGYDVATTPAGDVIEVTIASGTAYQTDDGGVLLVGALPDVLGASSLAFTNAASAPPSTRQEETEGEATATVSPETETASLDLTASPVVEGGAAASGEGQIVYEAVDEATGSRHVYRVAARAGAEPEDISQALDALGSSAPDDWIGISPDGEWLLLGTERFDSGCTGWPCLAVVPADLSAGEAVLIGGAAVHSAGFGAIASGGALIVYPGDGGPHQVDLWAIRRQDDGWSEPLLLSADSPYAFQDTPALAADGTRVVFDCGDQPYAGEGTALCEVGTDGSGFRVVLTPADAPSGPTPGGALHHPDYAPDGGIVFQSTWTDAIWRLPPGEAMPVPVGSAFASDNSPCVLADGRIASLWLGRPDGEGVYELKVMTPDGDEYAMVVTDISVEDIGCGG